VADLTPRDAHLVDELANSLWLIEGNYQREGAGPGSRFEGQTLQTVQAQFAVRRTRQWVADLIAAHADKHAPPCGNQARRTLRRHLLIAVQVATPEPTTQEISHALHNLLLDISRPQHPEANHG
jgi:hypothetical protein